MAREIKLGCVAKCRKKVEMQITVLWEMSLFLQLVRYFKKKYMSFKLD
jgi:hypothetical protein